MNGVAGRSNAVVKTAEAARLSSVPNPTLRSSWGIRSVCAIEVPKVRFAKAILALPHQMVCRVPCQYSLYRTSALRSYEEATGPAFHMTEASCSRQAGKQVFIQIRVSAAHLLNSARPLRRLLRKEHRERRRARTPTGFPSDL